MDTNQEKYGAKLNFRGKARRFGVKSLDYVKVNGKQNIIIIGATLVLFLIFTLINSSFASSDTLVLMIKMFTPYAILGLGVTFVIATGGIDLSIGTVMFASAVVASAICRTTTSHNSVGIIPIVLVVGTLFGLINGLLIAKCKIPPFIATLGTMLFSRGISAVMAEAINKTGSAVKYPTTGWMQDVFVSKNGFPTALLWVIALAIICMVVMYKTKVGRYILSIGSNEEATRLSGVNVDKYKIIAYVICGLLAGFAAIFWAAAYPAIPLSEGSGKELDAIAGVYIGGTSTTGGSASVTGTVFGAIILVVIRQGLNLTLSQFDANVSATFVTYAVTGLIVVGAVLLDVMKKKSASKAKKELSATKYKKSMKEKIENLNLEKDYALSAKDNAEAVARVVEINAEITALKAEMKAQLPVLKEEDRKVKEQEKKHKAEIIAAEKAERAEFKSAKKAEKEHNEKN